MLSLPMRLVPCSPPIEPLDAAPRTALMRDLEPGADWEGFWSRSTDAYYTRCTTSAGATHWYRISDEADGTVGLTATPAGARVLPFRGEAMRRVSCILAASPSGRPMLVGTARRGAR
jgi:hypothetical protein